MKLILKHLEYILILPLLIMSIILGFTCDNIMLLISGGFLLCFVSYFLLIFNNKKVKIASGIISLINGPFFIVILLLLTISMVGKIIPLYYLIYSLFYLIFKIFTIIHYRIINDLESIYYKEFSIIMISYLSNLILCILLYNYNDGNSLFYLSDLFNKLFIQNSVGYETSIFILLIIKITVNFITSNFIAYYTASSLITISKNEKLTLKEKIKSVTNFFIKYNITFIFVELFTFIIMINYATKMTETNNYIFMAFYYLIILVLRTLVVIWDYVLKKKYKNEQYKIYRRRFILLIITSATFLLSFQALNGVLIYISQTHFNNSVSLLWLILIILPFSGYGYINAILSFRKAKYEDNAYALSISTISLVSSLYMFFGALIYFLSMLNETVAFIIWIILFSFAIFIELFFLIRALVIGIKGIAGKRKKEADFYNNEIEADDLV